MEFGESTIASLTQQFTDTIGLGWKRRSRLLISQQARLAQLAEYDSRICVGIDGLLHIGEPGLQDLSHRLNSEVVPRDLFAWTIQACVVSDPHAFNVCVALAEAMPHLHAAFLAALDWTSPAQINELMKKWRTNSELCRLANLHLLADERFDCLNLSVYYAQTQTELRLLLRAARLRGRSDWVRIPHESTMAHLSDDLQLQLCRHYLLFDGEHRREQVLEQAWDHMLKSAEEAELWVALFAGEPSPHGERLAQLLRKQAGMDRRYIVALAGLGLSRCVPELIEMLDSPELARLAAYAISMITGSMPEEDNWREGVPVHAKAPTDVDRSGKDPDQRFPWPDKKQFTTWWNGNKHRFDANTRYLLGYQREPRALLDLLGRAALVWRPTIAWILQRQIPFLALDTEAIALLQIANLARLKQHLEPGL